MAGNSFGARLRAFLRAWPWPGAIFILFAFLISFFWFLTEVLEDVSDYQGGWYEPLAAIIGGIGAFLIATVLIFRRVEAAESEAQVYRLARGLATGYYFNFVRPLIGALRDPDHPIHIQAVEQGAARLGGLVVGIPYALAEFAAETHNASIDELATEPGEVFRLSTLSVEVAGRPRPISVKLATSIRTGVGLLVDIPTTLVVIPDFARFIAEHESQSGGDERIIAAREEIVAVGEVDQFGEVLEEFENVIARAGAQEEREQSPATLLHIVPLKRLRRRLTELAES